MSTGKLVEALRTGLEMTQELLTMKREALGDDYRLTRNYWEAEREIQAALVEAEQQAEAQPVTYHLGACITDGKLYATVMRREPNSHITVVATAEIAESSLRAHDGHAVMSPATPSAQAEQADQATAPTHEPYGYLRQTNSAANPPHGWAFHFAGRPGDVAVYLKAPAAGAEPDMFWDASDGERFGHDIPEIIADYGPGDVVKIDCAKRMPSVTVRVIGDEGDYEVISTESKPPVQPMGEQP